MRLTQPSAPISHLSQRTQKRRAAEVRSTRTALSAESSSVLLETEFKSLGKRDKEMLLDSAGIRAEMSPEEGLALKASLGLPWNRLRLLRRYKELYTIVANTLYMHAQINTIHHPCRWLNGAGVRIGSERKQRTVSSAIIDDNLTAELTPFSFKINGGDELRGAPHAYTPSLKQKVLQLLDENDMQVHAQYCMNFQSYIFHIYRIGNLMWFCKRDCRKFGRNRCT